MMNTEDEHFGEPDPAEAIERATKVARERWEQFSGQVLDQDADGHPRRWICGRDDAGHPVDPPDVEAVIHYLNARGQLEGKFPTAGDYAEQADWRDAA